MMKKIKLFSVLLLIVFCSGCVNYEGKVSIDKYKGMDMEIKYSALEDDGSINTESKDRMARNGFSIDKYNEGNNKGIKVTYQTKNIDKISISEKKDYNLVEMGELTPNGMFTVKKGLFKNKYSSNLIFDASSYLYEYKCNDGTTVDYDSYKKGMNCKKVLVNKLNKDFNFVVEVEGGVLKNNASSVKDNQLTWKLNSDKVNKIEFEFERTNYYNVAIVVTIIVVIIMIILTSIADNIVLRDKTKEREERRRKAKKEAMAERVVTKEKVVKKKTEEKKKEPVDTDLSDMFDSNYSNKKKIPEMDSKLIENGKEESSFRDLYK